LRIKYWSDVYGSIIPAAEPPLPDFRIARRDVLTDSRRQAYRVVTRNVRRG
jgi:hypothetical protein